MLITLRGQRVNCKAIVSPTETIVKALKIKIKKERTRNRGEKGTKGKYHLTLYQYLYHLTSL